MFYKKNPDTYNETSQTIDKFNKESFSTWSQKAQNALIQSRDFKQPISFMGNTILDTDIDLEQKRNKINFLEDKIGTPDSEIVEEMNWLDLNKISSKNKCDGIMNKVNKTLSYHKYRKIQIKKTLTFKKKICFDNDLSMETTSWKLSVCLTVSVFHPKCVC